MVITITLPEGTEAQLRRRAHAQQRSVEEVAIELLDKALETDVDLTTPEEVVARILATPPNPKSFRPAVGSLAEALRLAEDDPDFDLATWNEMWAAVEAEMREITHANAKAEGPT